MTLNPLARTKRSGVSKTAHFSLCKARQMALDSVLSNHAYHPPVKAGCIWYDSRGSIFEEHFLACYSNERSQSLVQAWHRSFVYPAVPTTITHLRQPDISTPRARTYRETPPSNLHLLSNTLSRTPHLIPNPACQRTATHLLHPSLRTLHVHSRVPISHSRRRTR